MADTSKEEDYLRLDEFLNRTYESVKGAAFSIARLAIDSGYNTNTVYNWVRRHQSSRVMAVKGVDGTRPLVSLPTKQDVSVDGHRKIHRGVSLWLVGTDTGKKEFYGWLGLPAPEQGQPYPSGFCHYPQYEQEFFKQITAEHLVTTTDKRGYQVSQWQLKPGRQNHFLDTSIYARAAAHSMGLDRMKPRAGTPPPVPDPVVNPPVQNSQNSGIVRKPRPPKQSSWLAGRRGR
jgi:phage terminase large subunit GpA-like protein